MKIWITLALISALVIWAVFNAIIGNFGWSIVMILLALANIHTLHIQEQQRRKANVGAE